MRNTFIFILICIPLFAKEPSMDISASGLGFLSPALEGEYFLYRSFEDTKPFDTLSFRSNGDGTLSFVTKTLGDRLKPYHIFEGNSYEESKKLARMGLGGLGANLMFRVIDKTEGDPLMQWDAEHRENIYAHDKFLSSFLVVLNEETGETAVIRAAHGVGGGSGLYESWEQYLKRVEFIAAKNRHTIVTDRPKGKIIFQNKERYLPYTVLEVEGDYIKVEKDLVREFNFEGLDNADGWLRWREGKRLLIEITEFILE